MTHAPFRSLVLGLILSLALLSAGCDDPSNVGVGVIGEAGGEPTLVEAPLQLERDTVREATGATLRVLAGTADDPLLGTIAAQGYLDFAGPSPRPTGFEDSTLTGAVLRLTPDYAYGDTTATLRFVLRAMQEEWMSSGAPADTSLQPIVGREIGAFSFAAGDTLVEYRLPEEWLDQNRDLLRDTTFAERFHGFQLTSTSREAVVGFGQASELHVFTEADTLSYRPNRRLTTLRHDGEGATEEDGGALPDGRLLVQDGRGLAASFDVAVADSALRNASLNRLALRLPTDRDALEGNPAFYRPPLQTLRLFRVSDDGTSIPLADLTRSDEDGVFRISDVTQRETLRQFYQSVLLGQTPLDEAGRFRLEAPGSEVTGNTAVPTNTLDAALLYAAEDGGAEGGPAPRLVLTVTSSE